MQPSPARAHLDGCRQRRPQRLPHAAQQRQRGVRPQQGGRGRCEGMYERPQGALRPACAGQQGGGGGGRGAGELLEPSTAAAVVVTPPTSEMAACLSAACLQRGKGGGSSGWELPAGGGGMLPAARRALAGATPADLWLLLKRCGQRRCTVRTTQSRPHGRHHPPSRRRAS